MVKKKTNKKGGKDDWDDSVDIEVPSLNDQIDESDIGKPSASAFGLLADDDEDGGGLMSAISKSKKKKDKKKQTKVEFSDDDKPSILDNLPLSDDEFDDVFSQPVKSKKGKNKKTVLSFDSLGDLSDVDEDIPKPSKKEKKKKKDKLPAFDALEIEDELEDVPEPVTSSKKDKKKKNDKLPAFDDISNEDELDEQVETEILQYTPPVPKGKAKKDKKKGDDLDALAALIEDDTVVVESTPAKGKKNKKGKKSTQDDLDALAALIEDDSVVPEPTSSKNQKGKKGKKAEEVEAQEPAEDTGEIKIKSAKQKEKERKERQKEERKRQAALQKQTEEASADKEVLDVSETPAPIVPETSTKGKKGKKGPTGAIAALKKQMEAQRAAEAEILRLQQEEEARVAAEERRLAEEKRLREEAKEAKRKADAEKKEQLRKEGKLLTKAQKEAKKKAELRLQSMIATGAIVAGLKDEDEGKEDTKPKRIVYSSKKKKQPNANAKIEETKSSPVPEPKVEPKPVEVPAKAKEEEEEEDNDDWEKKSFDDVVPSPALDDIKDSWDQSSDEEQEEVTAPVVEEAVAPVVEEKDESEEESEEEDSEEEDSDDDDDDDDSDEDSSDEELTTAQKMALQRKMESAERRKKRLQEALASRSKDDLRSPICCILGHVDTGKTKLLDKIRQTNVQEGEAGGITQQIGATYFPVENIIQKTAVLGKDGANDYKLPGLLVIDTPGHESFTNLRSRGSSLCNIAILVVDIMHGLEPQTLESLRLLRDKKTPFIVALNKIDRIYGWKATPNNGFQQSLKLQPKHVVEEFETRVTNTIIAFAEQGLNAKLYYENKNFAKYVSFVPTSAITGEGIPDILDLLVTLTQTRLSERLMYVSELECTVLEVKVIEGLGTTIDVVLSNGYLNEGDKIVVCGLNGPIVTQVRALLTPQPLRELRVKSQYVHHKRVKAALGIKISAPDLEKAIAGSRLMVVGPDDDEDDIRDAVMEDLETLLKSIDTSGRGVCVQASTLGSLEALLEFLRTSKIPVSGINIGPVHKKDIVRTSAMLEKAKEFAVLLAFDVEVDKEAQHLADSMGVKIFTADIIYHLFDQFTAYNKMMIENKRKEQAPSAVFPCVLKMVPGAIFNKRDPIVIGANVIEGTLRLGTPLCVVNVDPTTKKRDIVTLGTVSGIELNHKPMEIVKKGTDGAGVAVKIDAPLNEAPRLYGRHFFDTNEIYSKITRHSINVLKESFREDLSKDEWGLVVKLKKTLDVV